MNIAPKNEKLGLGILQNLEQLLGLGLRWVILAYPQPSMSHFYSWVRVKHLELGLGLST